MLGDLMLDVVVAPARALESGTDVPGRISLVQGGSAANTARWLGRLGGALEPDHGGRARCHGPGPGRDAPGRRRDPAGRARAGCPDRADRCPRRRGRGAQLRGRPRRGGPSPARGPASCLVQRRGCAPPAGLLAARRAARGRRASRHRAGTRGRRARQRRPGVDRTVAGRRPALGAGADRGRRSRPVVRHGQPRPQRSSAVGPWMGCSSSRPRPWSSAGPKGATVLARVGDGLTRFEVATEHVAAADTTGAGDAFDAGFLVGWFAARAAGRSLPASLQRAAVAGHRAATRQLSTPRAELPLG